jgi:hypothetical protein
MFWASSGIERGKSAGLVLVRGAPMSTAGSWAWYERARAHGARVLEPPADREYSERECAVEDLAGHRWQFTETARDVAPEDYRPDCRALARTVTTSPTSGHLPAGAGGAPGARLP